MYSIPRKNYFVTEVTFSDGQIDYYICNHAITAYLWKQAFLMTGKHIASINISIKKMSYVRANDVYSDD